MEGRAMRKPVLFLALVAVLFGWQRVADAQSTSVKYEEEYLFRAVVTGNRFLSFVSDDTMPGRAPGNAELSVEEKDKRIGKWNSHIEALQHVGADEKVVPWKWTDTFDMVDADDPNVELAKMCSVSDQVADASGRNQQFSLKNINAKSATFAVAWNRPGKDTSGKVFVLRNVQCARELWITSWADVSNRWEQLLAGGNKNRVYDEMHTLEVSGRYVRNGGGIWRDRVRKFRLDRKVLPQVSLVNNSGGPVLLKIANAGQDGNFFHLAPGKTYDFQAVYGMVTDGVKWIAVPDEGFCEKDYIWKTNSAALDINVRSQTINIPDNYPREIKDEPKIVLPDKVLPSNFNISELSVSVEYYFETGKSNLTTKIDNEDLKKVSSGLQFTVKPHVTIAKVSVDYPGFVSANYALEAKSRDDSRLCFGTDRMIPKEGTATRMKRLPWPKIIVGKKNIENAFPKAVNFKVEFDGMDSVKPCVSEKPADSFTTDILNDQIVSGKFENTTNVLVKVYAWADEAKESDPEKPAAAQEWVYRVGGERKIQVPVHDYEPPEWVDLSKFEDYARMAVNNLLGNTGNVSPTYKNNVSRIYRNKESFTPVNDRNKGSVDRIKVSIDNINNDIRHLKDTKSIDGKLCKDTCPCRQVKEGLSYADEYSRISNESDSEKRLTFFAVAAIRGGLKNYTVDGLKEKLRDVLGGEK